MGIKNLIRRAIQAVTMKSSPEPRPILPPEGKMSKIRRSVYYVLNITGGEQRLRGIRDFFLSDLLLNKFVVDKVGARSIKNGMMKARAGKLWFFIEALLWKIGQGIRNFCKGPSKKTIAGKEEHLDDGICALKDNPKSALAQRVTKWWPLHKKAKKEGVSKEVKEKAGITFMHIFGAGYEGFVVYLYNVKRTDETELGCRVPGEWIKDDDEDNKADSDTKEAVQVVDQINGKSKCRSLCKAGISKHLRTFASFRNRLQSGAKATGSDDTEVLPSANLVEKTEIQPIDLPEPTIVITSAPTHEKGTVHDRANFISEEAANADVGATKYDVAEKRIQFEGGMKGIVIQVEELVVPVADPQPCKLKRRVAIKNMIRKMFK